MCIVDDGDGGSDDDDDDNDDHDDHDHEDDHDNYHDGNLFYSNNFTVSFCLLCLCYLGPW